MGKRGGGRSGDERNVRRRGSPEQAAQGKGTSRRNEEPMSPVPPSAAASIHPSPGVSTFTPVAGHVPARMEDERGILTLRLPKKDREVDTPSGYRLRKEVKPSSSGSKSQTASDSSAGGHTSDSSSNRSVSSDKTSLLAATKSVQRKPAVNQAAHLNPKMKSSATQSAQSKPAVSQFATYHPGHGDLPEDPDRRLNSAFLEFLNRFVKGYNDYPHYHAMVHYMKASGDFTMEVPFKHILMFNPKLAIAIVKHRRPELSLLPSVHRFLACHGLATKREIELKTSLVFDGVPNDITLVEEFFSGGRGVLVKELNNLFGEGHCATILADLAIALLGGFAARIIDTWKRGLSWGGNFGPKDMAVVDKQHYIITKKPEVVLGGDRSQRARAKLADLRSIDEIFTPQLDARKEAERQEPPDDSDLPLFYSQFCDALLGATEDEVEEEWFTEYITHNPVLKPPVVRHDFVCDSYLMTHNPTTEVAMKVLSKHPCPGYDDWQKEIVDSNIDVLTDVYYHSIGGKPKEGNTAGGSGDGTST